MRHLPRILPLLTLGGLFLSMACGGIPLFGHARKLASAFPPGAGFPEGPPPPDGAERLAKHDALPLRGFHEGQGHWMVVASLLTVPLAMIFPLSLGWAGARRKVLATLLVLLPLLFLLLLILLESFTGHLIGGMIREGPVRVRGTYMRFMALHVFGLPLFALLTYVFLLWVQVRISKRADPPASPPDQGRTRA
jgi:hypothetical protein